MLQVHITTIVLVACVTTRRRWLLPLLWTNSLLGCYYTYAERDTIHRRGVVTLGVRVYPSPTVNAWINVLSHVVAPIVLAHRLHWRGDSRSWYALALVAAYLACADLPNLYPSERHSLATYVAAYAALVVALSSVAARPSIT